MATREPVKPLFHAASVKKPVQASPTFILISIPSYFTHKGDDNRIGAGDELGINKTEV